MPNAQPAGPARSASEAAPALPPGHPLEARLAAWTQLRDQLAELAAQLEYLKLMLRLEQRKG
jgi:hypothetical protein